MVSLRPQTVVTPSLQRLLGGASPEAVADQWPVAGPEVEGALGDDLVAVTFAVDAPPRQEVLVHINGLVDSSRTDFSWALLPVVSVGSDGREVHAQAYLLPRGLVAGYRLVVQPHIPRDAGQSRPGWKKIHEAGRPDPLNQGDVIPTPLGGDAAVLTLSGAPAPHPAWRRVSVPDVAAVGTGCSLSSEVVGVGMTLLDTGRHDGLAVVFDAEQWRAVGLEAALARMGDAAPSVLLVDSNVPDGVGGASRARQDFLPDDDAVARVVEPALQALGARGDGWERLTRERILATGQSFGGLAAVGAVASTGWAGAALAQSASLHHVDPTRGASRPMRAQGLAR